jgi:chemotaxis signal transduction protein
MKTSGEPYCLIIDALEDIAEFSAKDICLLPALVEPFALKKGIWGVLRRNDDMILLLDFMRLLRMKNSGQNPSHRLDKPN